LKELRDYPYSGLYNHIRNSLVAQLQLLPLEGNQMLHAISSQYALMDMLKDESKTRKHAEKLSERCTLFLPYDSSWTVKKIDVDHLKVFGSAKKPMKLPCTCVPTRTVFPDSVDDSVEAPPVNPDEAIRPSGTDFSFMYKMDDLRKDLVVMKCCDIIRQLCLKRKGLEKLPIVSYRVLPCTKSSGFIELVNGDTLTDVGNITQYLFNKITGCGGAQAFIMSCAIASVLVYIFGIGDRHLDNLMITADGKLVNIDFGFLEGQDTMMCPYARIPDEIINYGNNSELFVKWCCCIYLELRRYAMHFHSFFMFLHTAEEDSKEDIKKFDDFIQDRFCVECDENFALKKLKDFLEKSQGSLLNKIRDIAHSSKRTLVGAYSAFISWWSSSSDSTTSTAAPPAKDEKSSKSDSPPAKSIIFTGSMRSSSNSPRSPRRRTGSTSIHSPVSKSQPQTLDDSFLQRDEQQILSTIPSRVTDDGDLEDSGVVEPITK